MRALAARAFPTTFARRFEPDRAELGIAGEALAARALRRRGFRILGRRVIAAGCELDLVTRDGPTLVCVEVKAGRDGPRAPREHLSRRTLARQRRAAALLAGPGSDARVDLVEVRFCERGRVEIRHLRDLGLRRP